jgi:hypothetical protein
VFSTRIQTIWEMGWLGVDVVVNMALLDRLYITIR